MAALKRSRRPSSAAPIATAPGARRGRAGATASKLPLRRRRSSRPSPADRTISTSGPGSGPCGYQFERRSGSRSSPTAGASSSLRSPQLCKRRAASLNQQDSELDSRRTPSVEVLPSGRWLAAGVGPARRLSRSAIALPTPTRRRWVNAQDCRVGEDRWPALASRWRGGSGHIVAQSRFSSPRLHHLHFGSGAWRWWGGCASPLKGG